jgi:putative copper export protein
MEVYMITTQTISFALITFLHDLFTITWIGGLIVLGLTILPSAEKSLGKGPQTKKLMSAIQKRHSTWVYISIGGLILTGILMARRSPDFGHLFSFDNPYSAILTIKHILVLIMIFVALYRSLVLARDKRPPTAAKERLNARLLLMNMILGTAVLLASGFLASIGAGPTPI